MLTCKVPPRNITMVAFHEKMPTALTEIISDISERITALGLSKGRFVPYQPNERHATLLGMEVLKIGGDLINANFLNNNGRLRTIEPLQLLSLVSAVVSSRQPVFTVRFGGFSQAYCNCAGFDLYEWECTAANAEFHAFNRTAYEGSFYASPNGPVMLTGWPITASSPDSFHRELYGLRLAAEECGFLDKYHTIQKPYWKDDDFYIRLGTFNNFPANQFSALVEQVRAYLAALNPAPTVDVTVADVDFVYYEEATPLTIRERLPLKDALADPKKLLALYARWTYEN